MLPTGLLNGVQGDGYGYDVAIDPARRNAHFQLHGRDNYLRDLGSLIKDEAAMKHFGNTMVLGT